jgi:hypothetical protein
MNGLNFVQRHRNATLRHFREGGNPSPENDFVALANFVWILPAMDSRLRGNDEVYIYV